MDIWLTCPLKLSEMLVFCCLLSISARKVYEPWMYDRCDHEKINVVYGRLHERNSNTFEWKYSDWKDLENYYWAEHGIWFTTVECSKSHVLCLINLKCLALSDILCIVHPQWHSNGCSLCCCICSLFVL